VITTFAGTGKWGNGGDGGPASAAQLNQPVGVIADYAGDIFIYDIGNHNIREVKVNGIINTISAISGYSDTTFKIADAAGNRYIADTKNNVVLKIDASGKITTFAGTGDKDYSGDGGPAVKATLDAPRGVTVDKWGNVYIADSRNDAVRRVDANGIITTFAGNGIRQYHGDEDMIGTVAYTRDRGRFTEGAPATAAQLFWPMAVAADIDGNVYIADDANHVVEKVTVPPHTMKEIQKKETPNYNKETITEDIANAETGEEQTPITENLPDEISPVRTPGIPAQKEDAADPGNKISAQDIAADEKTTAPIQPGKAGPKTEIKKVDTRIKQGLQTETSTSGIVPRAIPESAIHAIQAAHPDDTISIQDVAKEEKVTAPPPPKKEISKEEIPNFKKEILKEQMQGKDIKKIEILKRQKLRTDSSPPEMQMRDIPMYTIQIDEALQPEDTIPILVVPEAVQPQPDEAFNISADPDAEELTITISPGAYTSFTITSMAGNVLFQKSITNVKTKVDISGLLPARYYINLKRENRVKTTMFVKE